MPKINIIIEVKYKWWFKYLYLPTLCLVHEFTVNYVNIDVEVNWCEFDKILRKAIVFRAR